MRAKPVSALVRAVCPRRSDSEEQTERGPAGATAISDELALAIRAGEASQVLGFDLG